MSTLLGRTIERRPNAIAYTGRSARLIPASPFANLFTAKWAFWAFTFVLFIFYLLTPTLIYFLVVPNELYLKLTGLTSVTLASMFCGYSCKALDGRFLANSPRITVNASSYIFITLVLFTLYISVTLLTAPSIPILSSISASDANALSVERGEFLKGRQGAWVILLYLSSLLTSTLVPYCIVLAYSTRSRVRHLLCVLFLLFSVSFLVKALFFNLMIPLMALLAEQKKLGKKMLFVAFVVACTTLVVLIALSGYGSLDGSGPAASTADYFSSAYVPDSTFKFLVYRMIAVPIFSVVDTLHVHAVSFNGDLLYGSTSTFFSTVFGFERINLERFVAEYQYGGWNDFANSNVVFIADAYVNFGWLGVIIFGGMVGLSFRIFKLSQDIGIRSLALLYAFLLYSSPLIGMMLSNGFAIFFVQALFIRVRSNTRFQAH